MERVANFINSERCKIRKDVGKGEGGGGSIREDWRLS